MNKSAGIIAISRHRLTTDGEGITTLVAFHGCPLACRYCINPQSREASWPFRHYTTQELYAEVCVDELYFIATNGGVTFGGGEPCLYADFIKDFRRLCGNSWKLNLETSLNVPQVFVAELLPVVDTLIIDVKDMDEGIYRRYTGKSGSLMESNLRLLAAQGRQNDCLIRLPLIARYNTEADIKRSRSRLEELGFSRFDIFTYSVTNPADAKNIHS